MAHQCPACLTKPKDPQGRESISIYFMTYCVHRKSHINIALLFATALHVLHLRQQLGQDNHRLQYFNNYVQLHIVPPTEQAMQKRFEEQSLF